MKTIVLFAFLAFSLNGFAQTKPVLNHFQTHAVKVLPDLPGVNHEPAGKSPGILTARDLAKELRNRSGGDVSLNDSIYQWHWDVNTNDWQLNSKVTDIYYNADNYPTNYTYQDWTGASWENSSQTNLVYDASNYLTADIEKEWTGTAWKNSDQVLYTYDANHNQTSEVYQVWSGTAWVNEEQVIYTYNADGNVLTELDQEWNGTGWDNIQLITYTYDANKNQINYLNQSFNDIDLTWVNESQIIYGYDGNDKLSTYTYQTWDGVYWNNLSLVTYTYAGNNLSTILSQYWNTIDWANSSLSTYTYNASNSLTYVFTQSWNVTNWDNAARTYYTYNADNLNVKTLSENWNGTTWLRTSLSFFTYDENHFVQSSSNRYYYFDPDVVSQGDSTFNFFRVASAVKDFATDDSSISVFPNPGSGKFTISSEKSLGVLSVYNLLGERIYANDKLNAQSSAEVDLTMFGTGMYVITMTDGAKMYNRKVIIQ
ncbi:MAG TPA: T9SS type A sorting domain-containing protein [Saprospiraceae bacterium]|nr:T9SS type A sorting domain-containing protein [Saprospiraceae bacterium]